MSALAFERPLTAPVASDLAADRCRRAQRRGSRWPTVVRRRGPANRFEMVGSHAPPSGPATVNAPVSRVLLADTGLSITDLSAADVRRRTASCRRARR